MQMLQSSRSDREWMLERELMLVMSAVKISSDATPPNTTALSQHLLLCLAFCECVCVLCVHVCMSVWVCVSEHVCLSVCARICMGGKTQSVSEKQRYVGEQLKSDWFPSTEHQMYSLRRMGLCDGGSVIMLM